MRLRYACAFAAVLATAALVAGPAAASLYSQRRAELNVLTAVRVLNRWHVGVVDPSSMTLRSNTSVSCRGLGRATAGRYRRFRCTLQYGNRRVKLLYTAVAGPRRAYRLHRLG